MLQANFLVEGSNIRGEKSKEEHNTREPWVVRVRALYAKPRATRPTRSHTCLLSSWRSSPGISKKKGDCSQSIEDIKINNV